MNSPEPPVKKRAHQAEHVRKERDDLSDDESEYPRRGDNASPSSPAEQRVRMTVLRRVPEQAEEQEAGADRLPKRNQCLVHGHTRPKKRTEYREPRNMIVGMANENAIFL